MIRAFRRGGGRSGLDDLVDDAEPLSNARSASSSRSRQPFHPAEADAERLVECRELARSETPLISRLSVLRVTRKRSRRSRSMGCSAIDARRRCGRSTSGTSPAARGGRGRTGPADRAHRAVVADAGRRRCGRRGRAARRRTTGAPPRSSGSRTTSPAWIDVEVLAMDVLERVQVAGRRVAGFGLAMSNRRRRRRASGPRVRRPRPSAQPGAWR